MIDLPWFNFGKLPTDQELLDDLKLHQVEGMVGKSRVNYGGKRGGGKTAWVEDYRKAGFISFDEAANVKPETWERMRKWAYRNVLSVEERARIWEDEPLPMFMGWDVGNSPSGTTWTRAWFEDGRMNYEAVDPIEFMPVSDTHYREQLEASRSDMFRRFFGEWPEGDKA